MRTRLLRWLVCPLCSGTIEVRAAKTTRLAVSETDYRLLTEIDEITDQGEVATEIIDGALTCSRCRVYYPIYHGIPRMLTYATKVARVHSDENAVWIRQNLSGFNLPAGVAPPGEEGVLRNFSTEWTEYEWTGRSYWSATPEEVLEYTRFSLGTKRHPLQRKLVLEIGIGIGGIADGLSRTENCEIVGIDLGYAVDKARRYFGQNPRLHIVQASVFALPFRPATFDVVYSQGVLHHTFSTHTAFTNVARLPKKNGMLYVWLYSHDDERATVLRRILMFIENVVRPTVSRLPGTIQTMALAPAVIPYIVYQNFFRRRRQGREATAVYGWSEAMHAARDRLTPPFAHRHTYEEVADWFRSQSYANLELLCDDPLPHGFPESLQRCVGIRGFLQD